MKPKKLLYILLANSIALFHLLWGLWGAVGVVLALNGYYPKHPVAWGIYLIAMIANGFYLRFFKHCPLTVWEKRTRLKYNSQIKNLDAFSAYYLEKLTGIRTTAPIVWIFIWSIYIGNLIALLIYR